MCPWCSNGNQNDEFKQHIRGRLSEYKDKIFHTCAGQQMYGQLQARHEEEMRLVTERAEAAESKIAEEKQRRRMEEEAWRKERHEILRQLDEAINSLFNKD